MTNYIFAEKKPIKYRHEIKYNINHAEAVILSSRLRKLFKQDKYADSHGKYRVSSLYFDTPYDKALKEKLDGVRNREKFRIRYYNGQTDFMRVEKKMKTKGLCAKQSAVLTKEQTEKIIRGEVDFLLKETDPLLLEFYSKLKGQLLRPVKIVSYNRQAFLCEPGNVRITIDSDLCTTTCPLDFFDIDALSVNMSDGLTVLEVKYDAFLPEIVRLAISDPGRSSTAYSKYAICRRYE